MESIRSFNTTNSPLGSSALGQKAKTVLCICHTLREISRDITVRWDDDVLYKVQRSDFHRLGSKTLKYAASSRGQGKVTNLSVEERLLHFNVYLQMLLHEGVVFQRHALYSILRSKRISSTRINEQEEQIDAALTKLHKFLEQRDNAIRVSYDPGVGHEGLKTRRINEEFGEICRWTTIRGKIQFTSAGNPVKKSLLILNLSDHRLCKYGGGGS
ncbi:hypothetical protein Tco_1018949 [Tanacetum coccineum]|uniref:SAC domain-containing protein n=1 Tax=Tanacetum coccineum TaxID=301880 RepID=A0ABQ5FW99_9ASTR